MITNFNLYETNSNENNKYVNDMIDRACLPGLMYALDNGLNPNYNNIAPLVTYVEEFLQKDKDNVVEFYKKILEKGANPNSLDNAGITPLLMCAYNTQAYDNSEEILYLLIDSGADWNVLDKRGDDFLDILKDDEEPTTYSNTIIYNDVIKKYPKKYEDYLTKKDMEKFNI